MPGAIGRQAGRGLFGRDAAAYAAARPDYPPRVYAILRSACGLRPGIAVLEVGAGTGQATAPLLEAGCHVAAVEPDARLAAVLAERLKEYGAQLAVHRQPFESADLPEASFDLGIAATSLHWLEPEAALARAFRLLRPGGAWAMWWTVFGDPDGVDAFQERTQPLFAGLERSPSQAGPAGRPFALDRGRRLAELEKAGFASLACEEIRWNPVLGTDAVLALTATFSPVVRLPDAERARFLREIGRIVDEEFDGSVRRSFVTAIYTARKPRLRTPGD